MALEFENLWRQYRSRLESFVHSRVADPADAEDLLQEVFLRLHLNLCCLRDLSKLESWVFQIARNTIIDYYRTRRSTAEIPDDLPADDTFADEDPASQLALSLRELVESLPNPYKEALILTEYDGLSQAQAAGRLGISVPGMKSRVQRGRQKIRDMLLACCHFELDRYGRIIDYYERCCCCNPAV
jgi:RNA polymerase sigma-70 factor (ECF subfamily)